MKPCQFASVQPVCIVCNPTNQVQPPPGGRPPHYLVFKVNCRMAAQQSAAVARLTPPHHWPQPQLDLNPVVDKVPNTSFSHSEQNGPLKLGHDFSSQVSKVNIYDDIPQKSAGNSSQSPARPGHRCLRVAAVAWLGRSPPAPPPATLNWTAGEISTQRLPHIRPVPAASQRWCHSRSLQAGSRDDKIWLAGWFVR